LDDLSNKIEDAREKLAPYADSIVDRAVAWVVAHPKTTLSLVAWFFILFVVAASN
jgi:hypothetical protein